MNSLCGYKAWGLLLVYSKPSHSWKNLLHLTALPGFPLSLSPHPLHPPPPYLLQVCAPAGDPVKKPQKRALRTGLVSLFTIAKVWKQPKQPSTDD